MGFLSAKVLRRNGLIDGGLSFGGRGFTQICVDVSNLIGLWTGGELYSGGLFSEV